ncbi:abnormal spindle-like microcephaly-associated protein [Mytilus galloprovincialis]|uniref:Abnormal spindle-like microcephaly-associated protein n=1 Tax=Mytilus galloprovincialis TaxID=29158 RepID=A0A8B6FGN1_MYTGA|nr:abnormal spindle-like microcephaly-associated protein [Mytilus galloprovincialis]
MADVNQIECSPQIHAIWDSLDQVNGERVATSTPNSSTVAVGTRSPRRKSRRSWFEKPSSKYEIAVEKKRRSNGRKSEVEDEILMLTHFTNPPKISFGTLKPGQNKSRTLIIKNPHDYDQTVKVEKFPHKKYFSVQTVEFTILAKETFPFEITWEPEDEGNFREMILFVVDNSYRLQGFVFGTVEAPKKKVTKRKGLLGSKVQKPFSILHTQSLANIKKSYSPQKGEKKISSEQVQQKSNIENEPPREITLPFEAVEIGQQDQEKDVESERRKSHRRSSTYVKMPDLGVSPIGLPPGTGKKTNSNDILHSTVRSDIESQRSPLDGLDVEEHRFNSHTPQTPENQKFGSIHTETQGFISPNSFLQDSLCQNTENAVCKQQKDSISENGENQKAHDMKNTNKNPKTFLSPDTFLKDLNNTIDGDKKGQYTANNIPSPDAVLNKSIPHDILVRQLDSVKTKLQKNQVLKERKSTTNCVSRKSLKPAEPDNVRRETFTKSSSGLGSQQQRTINNTNSCRRESFMKTEKKSNPFVEVPSTCTSSPRRTTFIVKGGKKPINNKRRIAKPTAKIDKMSKQNGHLHIEKDIITTETIVQDEVETVSTTKITEVVDTYTCTIIDDKQVIHSPERSTSLKEHHTTTKTEVSKTVDSSTVVKNRTLPTPERSLCGKQLFSPHTGQSVYSNSSINGEVSIGSPRRLPDSPLAAVVSKRSTMTVTKEKPSEALIEQTERRLSTCLFGQDDEKDGSGNMDEDSLEKKSIGKWEISVIEEGNENLSSPLLSKISFKQNSNIDTPLQETKLAKQNHNFSLDTPMREAGLTKQKYKVELDTPMREAGLTTQKYNLELDTPMREAGLTNQNYNGEIDTPMREAGLTNQNYKGELDTPMREAGFTKHNHNGELDTPMLEAGLAKQNNNGELDTPMREAGLTNQNIIFELDTPMREGEFSKDVCKNFINDLGTHHAHESFDLKQENQIKAVPTNNFDVCENGSPEHCGKDSDLELPTNHLAENKREIENTESTVKRRSFWEKPCDLSITFENLDTPMREVYNNMDIEDRKKHRRSFWEKPDESKLTPVTFKGINNSGNVSDHDELSSPMHQNIQKNTSSVEDSYQESVLVDSVEEYTSFPTTPYHLLPKTPNPDNSRRSTHVVEKPKIFKLDEVQKKKLFADEADVSIDQVEINICCDENVITSSSIVPLKNQNKEPKEEQKKEDGYHESMTKETAIFENKLSNNLDNPQDTNNSMRLKDSYINPSVNENKNKNPNGLFFISCSSTKAVDKQVKSTVTKSILRKQPNKPVTTTIQKKVSPKRPLSQARMSENKRRKTNETIEQNDEIRNNKNTERSKQSTVNKQPSLKGSAAVQGRVKAPSKGVAQSKLLLMKKTKTALPKHPMPFAAKNMYYDERWMQKQERGFVHWLNFVLTPPDEYQQTTKVKVDAGSLCVDNNRNNVKLAPTREVLSFRAYSQHRRLNQLRRAACKLFQSQEVVHVVQKVEVEVESDRLYIRKDRKVHADLGLKQAILDMLLSFNPLWLRIGLETTFGEMIMIQNNGDVIGLSRFIITRVLGNPDIACEFSHPSVPHLYSHGYAEAISRHLLKKFLILVFFLDHAKSKRLVPQDPCLFCKDAEYKTCKTMLIEFSRDYLAGEGDITRHLGYLGYQIKHTQTAMDEFDYAVSNLATDLKDGIRLARVMEILSEDHTLTKKLRAPAISRLQKIHNMDVMFQILAKQGVNVDLKGTKVTCRDVVDGHREKTLKLLWCLIVQYQVSLLLNKEQLKEEIRILERSLMVKNQLAALQRYEEFLSQKKRDSLDPDLFSQNELVMLLLKWCRVVSAYYGIQVENFTVSFGDGRVLCHLIHHYHPSLLPREIIKHQTMRTLTEDNDQANDQNNSLSDSFGQAPFTVKEDDALFEQMLSNEKENFKTLYEKVSELGGIPLMLRSADMSNTIPDEKVVVTYVTYLCARLLDIRHESRAARVIQLAWRRHHLQKVKKDFVIKQKAAVVIQKAVRCFLHRRKQARQETASVKIQTAWRGFKAKKLLNHLKWKRDNEKKIKAATVIQRYMLAQRDRSQFQLKVKAAITIQSTVRSYLHQQRYRNIIKSIRTIQSKYSAYKLQQKCRSEYVEKKMAAITIQSVVRMITVRKNFKREKAALKIQTTWRMYTCKKLLKTHLSSVVKIQTYYRMVCQKRKFKQLKKSAVTLQRYFSTYLLMRKDRETYHKQLQSCLKIQRWWKSLIESKKAKHIAAAIKIQAAFRGFVQKKIYVKTRRHVIRLQASARRCFASTQYKKQKQAVLKIQEWYRRHLLLVKCQKEFRQKKQAVVYLQACIRRWRCMKEYQNMKTSVIKIQSSVRTFLAVTSFKKKKKAVAVIQKHHHAWSVMKIEKRKYDKIKQACVVIQSYWRGRKVRQTLVKMNKAAIIIQTKFRGQIARDYYLCLKEFVIVCQRRLREKLQKRTEREEIIRQTKAATVIQTRFRGFIEKQRFRRSIHSIVKLQTNIRGYLQRKRFLQLKHSTLLLQRHYRAYKECKYVRTMYLVKKGAAITIQGYFRGFMVRKMVKKLNVSAIKVQSVYRGYKQKQCYLSMRKAAKTCQALYRAKITGMKERYKYLMIKISALVIQRHYRSYKISKVERERHQAALKIQTLYRSHRGRTQYLKLKQNVIKCQQLYRNKTMARFCRRQYLCTKTAVVTIQAIFRGWKIRKLLFRQHKAATVIQSAYRRYVLHNKFNHLKQATLTVQRIYRAHVLGSYTRTEFLIKKGAAMTLQASYKGWKVRKGIVQQHQKAKTIQSAFRGYIQQKNYQRLKKAAVLCQNVYRTHVLGSYARKEFINLKNAIIFIQARYRGLKVRQEMRMKNEAATKIQSVYRGYIQYGQFTSLKKAVLSCQKIYRNHRIGAKHRKAFLLTKGSTITLQAFIRGWKVRQEMRMKNEAATKIQSVYRGYIQYGQFTCLKESVISCQKIYRNCIKGAKMRKEFLLTKGAIITLQAFIRGWKVRKNVKRQFQASVVIQSAFRRYIEHNKFTKLRKVTVACQNRYRASILSKQIRRQFLIQKGAALIIEDWYCAYLERCKEKQRHNRATVIQKVYRGYRVRHKNRKVKDAAVTIQRHYKNYRTTRQMRNQYLSMQVSAVIIQKYCRGYQVRKRYAENIKHVIRIQSVVKSYLQRKRFIKLKSAALVCQKRFRAVLSGHQQRLAFLKERSAAVLLQSHIRRWLAQRTFNTQLSHIVTIQKSFRGYLARKNLKSLRKAACIIQNRWRVVMEMHKIQRDDLTKKNAAITIQSSWKAYLAKKEYKRLCCLTIRLQALVHGKQQRLKYMNLKSSAITIQRHFRACMTGKNIRMEYVKTIQTVVKLQALVRGNQARMLHMRMKACITIQSHYKQYKCVKNYQKIRRAVITIQSQYRGMLERRHFQKKVEAVVKIQKCVKRRSFANRVRNYLEERRKSAILIQACYRGYQDRKTVHRLKAAIKIQALVRMKLQRLEYKRRIMSVIVVQSCVRRYLVQKETGKLRKEIRAVICIQKAYRKVKARQQLKLQKKARQAYVRKFTKMLWVNLAAITIQRFYKKCKLMQQAKEKLGKILIIQRWIKGRLCRLRYLKLQRSIVVLQRKARFHLKTRQEAAVKIQTAVRKWLLIRKQKLKIKAIVKLQSIWRGEQVRRRSIGQKIEKIRKRVEKANRSATEENKLGNRMASALDYLLRYKQLSHILEVLIHLDVATRLSAACCEKFVSVNAVHVIYRLMRGCNRSQPHMELIKYSVSILLNLAKYEKTVYEVYNVDGSVDTLIELMQIYREKGAIFNSTCMLLGILGMLDICRMEIHQDKKLAEKIRSIHLLTARKHKIDESRQLRQARLLAAKSFNCSLPIHHKKQHKIKPDWVLRKDKMKELQDPLSAVNFVMDSFQLKSK